MIPVWRFHIWRDLFLVVDSGPTQASPLPALRQRILTIDRELAIADVSYMDDRLRQSLWRQRFTSIVMSAFAVASLGIAVLGVFGVMSYLIARRSHEMGVRMALGATSNDIMKMVLRQSGVLVIAGTPAGLTGANFVTRLLRGLLFGIEPTDPLTFGAVA